MKENPVVGPKRYHPQGGDPPMVSYRHILESADELAEKHPELQEAMRALKEVQPIMDQYETLVASLRWTESGTAAADEGAYNVGNVSAAD
jgi:hypothetical protein